MSILKFPYLFKKIDSQVIADPTIPLEVETPLGYRKIYFLVDSGADATTLPLKKYKDLFGLDTRKMPKTKIGGIEGQGVNAYIKILKFRAGASVFEARCYFIESRTLPLLGRLDIWDKFSIVFDNMKQEVIFKPIKKQQSRFHD